MILFNATNLSGISPPTPLDLDVNRDPLPNKDEVAMILLFFLLVPLIYVRGILGADYHERLVLRPLPPASLLASFNFRSNTSLRSFEQQNFRYFPRSLGQILQHAHTRELHIRFSLGRWDAESWGARPWGGAREGGTGVELWAWVDAENENQADKRWITLTNALSGLFCASLNFIDSTRTIRPVISFDPAGDHLNTTKADLHLLHGTLPGEVVCTENLTPFLKLLPCKGKAGISSLFDGHKLFDSAWQSMSIDVRPLCPTTQEDCILQIDQTIDMVLDIERSKRLRSDPIPRPVPQESLLCDPTKSYYSHEACFPLENQAEPAWSLVEIFGKAIRGQCPLTEETGPESETLCLDVPHEREVYTTAPFAERKDNGGFSRCWKLPANELFDLELPTQHMNVSAPLAQPPLYVDRSFTGYGQERGGVQALLTNPSPTNFVEFVYLESLPWFMKPYLHTLTAQLSSGPVDLQEQWTFEDLIRDMYYRPALDRHRGTQLEVLIRLPPDSTVTLSYAFEKAILRYTEYPPDANRGFDIAPAIIRLTSPIADPNSPVYLRTTSLLLPLPTPDFSMPYNVIILTSTVMALAFGSVFNIIVRRFVGADEVETWNIKRLKGKVAARLQLIMAKFIGERKKKE
ncbi:MAG: Subunit of the glycosylphosphatidylinositol transamidase complex-like protein [Vezdaea aestivalis]|nr:MAG: Subunit of the glycosylphosphatidylinositol transamidase complex-like protein [Vezdaea aestivalis]